MEEIIFDDYDEYEAENTSEMKGQHRMASCSIRSQNIQRVQKSIFQ